MALFGELREEAADPDELGDVRLSLQDDVTVVTLVGEVDLAMSERLDDACRAVLDRGQPVRIDVSRLDFIDSSGLGFLMPMVRTNPGGKRPALVGASPLVLDTIRIVGLADLVDML